MAEYAEYLVQSESITAVADAIREKGGTTAPLSFPAGMAEAVRNIQSGGGPTYVVGTPVSFTLTGWDPDVQGTTYKLKAVGYKPGANGVQLGLPSDSSTANTQAVVASALTIANTDVTAPDKEKNVAGFTAPCQVICENFSNLFFKGCSCRPRTPPPPCGN